jgi:YVTN family beta-propeller protein
MEFRLLGQLEVWSEGRRLQLGTGRQRALLALLLLHANEVVATDRLIDLLWAGSPPTTASKVLQNLVSQLRRAIGDGADGAQLVTQAPGYVLRVDRDAIDARRFERLVEEGRRALSAGATAEAAERLREALVLWRGPPLNEFTYEPFAKSEVDRLDELRLRALEDRIEADLALGRQHEVLAELEALLGEHPLRERLRAQLMLALYRSGRQAEALQVYQDGRRLLAEELGLEPGPALRELEQAILTHDPVLGALPARIATRPESVAARPRLRQLLGGAALAGAVAVAAAAAIVLLRDEGTAPVVVPNSVVRIDPATNKVTAVTVVGRDPGSLTGTDGAVFVTNVADETVSRLDIRSGEVVDAGGLRTPNGLATDGRSVWVGNMTRNTVLRLDAATLAVEERLGVPGESAAFVALGGGSLWISQPVPFEVPDFIARVDLDTGRVHRFPAELPMEIAVGGGAAWVAEAGTGSLIQIGLSDNRVRRIEVGSEPSSPAVGFGSVWVASADADAVWRVDAVTGRIEAVVPAGEKPFAVASGAGAVWVASFGDGTVSRIDPSTNAVTATIPVGHRPQSLAVVDGAVWVGVARGAIEPYATFRICRSDSGPC